LTSSAGIIGYHRRLQDLKNDFDSPQKSQLLFICKVKKKGALNRLSIANPNLSEITFSVRYLDKVKSLGFSFQAIDELVCSGCTEVLAICNFRSSN
jgi:hypothetical protein